jgi:5'-nucleotidase/UDP-sugar diphosphatase
MKTTEKRIFLANRILSFALTVIVWLGGTSPLRSESVTLIHSNDIHGNIKPYLMEAEGGERWVGGMEAASHYLREIKGRDKNVLVIDKGDLLTGTLAADLKYQDVVGGAMMEFLNRLGYDAWSYGNHDFDRGQQNAARLAGLARFPTIMSNIVNTTDQKVFSAEPYRIFALGKIKVGVIAVMEENFLTEVRKGAAAGLEVLPMAAALKAYLPKLEKETDLTVVIAHCPFAEAERIAGAVPGIDVVLVASNDGQFKNVNGVLVQSTWGYQKTLGYLKLEVEKHKVASYEQKLIWLWAEEDLNPEPSVSALVKEVEEAIGEEFAKVIGQAGADYVRSQYPQIDAPVESPLGDWIADVMRWKTGAQIGLHNSGAIRADIKAGPVTKADVFNVSPFHNTLIVFRLTGRQIKDVLEHDVERAWDRLQVSGLRYRFYSKAVKPYGRRVEDVELNGEILVKEGVLLHPEKAYSVVSNDYLVGQAKDKYFGFAVEAPQDTGFSLYQTLVEWLEEYKTLEDRPLDRIVEIH